MEDKYIESFELYRNLTELKRFPELKIVREIRHTCLVLILPFASAYGLVGGNLLKTFLPS